ncbi:hypothetical protein FM119_03535 [Mycetocola reblochoni REB411]|uniref:Uncharacterized protein n=1 Tax=Mycetocola reblochoni REB411 TaxID=1255698 RepID=A0A1R4ITL3_9MICO|nr:hypothetical protein FM119_03535 [Mycetocola reblochoni REB411]
MGGLLSFLVVPPGVVGRGRRAWRWPGSAGLPGRCRQGRGIAV